MAKIDKLLEHAKDHFAPGEDALVSVFGSYEIKRMGSDSVRDGIFIATNQRLLFYAKKLTGFDLESVPYGNISSLEMGKGFLGHYINFFASGNSAKMKWIQVGDVSAFVEVVKAQMEAAKTATRQVPPPADDPVSLLEQLGKLHTSGVLTDTEFESKKAEILARIKDNPSLENDLTLEWRRESRLLV